MLREDHVSRATAYYSKLLARLAELYLSKHLSCEGPLEGAALLLRCVLEDLFSFVRVDPYLHRDPSAAAQVPNTFQDVVVDARTICVCCPRLADIKNLTSTERRDPGQNRTEQHDTEVPKHVPVAPRKAPRQRITLAQPSQLKLQHVFLSQHPELRKLIEFATGQVMQDACIARVADLTDPKSSSPFAIHSWLGKPQEFEQQLTQAVWEAVVPKIRAFLQLLSANTTDPRVVDAAVGVAKEHLTETVSRAVLAAREKLEESNVSRAPIQTDVEPEPRRTTNEGTSTDFETTLLNKQDDTVKDLDDNEDCDRVLSAASDFLDQIIRNESPSTDEKQWCPEPCKQLQQSYQNLKACSPKQTSSAALLLLHDYPSLRFQLLRDVCQFITMILTTVNTTQVEKWRGCVVLALQPTCSQNAQASVLPHFTLDTELARCLLPLPPVDVTTTTMMRQLCDALGELQHVAVDLVLAVLRRVCSDDGFKNLSPRTHVDTPKVMWWCIVDRLVLFLVELLRAKLASSNVILNELLQQDGQQAGLSARNATLAFLFCRTQQAALTSPEFEAALKAEAKVFAKLALGQNPHHTG